MAEFQVTGLADFHKAMQQLTGELEGAIMRGALRAGQNVIAEEARNNLRAAGAVDGGALLKSIRVRLRSKSQKHGWVRMRTIAGNQEAWYSHILEFGSASHYQGKGRSVKKPYIIKAKDGAGRDIGLKAKRRALKIGVNLREQVLHPGVKPRAFMRRAFDTKSQAALDAMAEYIRKRLPRELKKAGVPQ